MAPVPRDSRIFVGVNRFKHIVPPKNGNSEPQARGVFRRDAGDGRWRRMADGLPENCDVNVVLLHPADPEVVFAGTTDGPYYSRDGGERWHRADFPKEGSDTWSILFDPADSRIVYAGTSPIGICRSDDGGEHWRRMPDTPVPQRLEIPFAHRVMRLAINAARRDELFAIMEVNGVMCSRDRGETWRDCNDGLVKLAERPRLKNRELCPQDYEGMLDGHAVATSPAAPGTVFAALRMGLFESGDSGASWEDMELGRSAHLDYSRDIRVSPHDPQTLYAGVGVSVKNDNGAIYRSDDLGKSWKRFDHSIDVKSSIMSVAFHRSDPDIVVGVARFGQVIGTWDGGRTWREFPLPENCGGGFSIACG